MEIYTNIIPFLSINDFISLLRVNKELHESLINLSYNNNNICDLFKLKFNNLNHVSEFCSNSFYKNFSNIIIDGDDLKNSDVLRILKHANSIKTMKIKFNNSVNNSIFPYIKNIEDLTINYCYSFKGNIPNLTHLKNLHLSYTNICTIDCIDTIESLDILGNNNFDFEILKNNNLKKLSLFCIDNHDIIKYFKNLHTLKLECCDILNNTTLKEICENNKDLYTLSIKCCDNITNIDCLQNLTQLYSLDISECKHIINLPYLVQLKELNISNCELDKAELSDLKVLNMSHSSFDMFEIPNEDLCKLVNLETLIIDSCLSIDENVLNSLVNLTTLDLINCHQLTNRAFEKLSKLNKLTITYCSSISNEAFKYLNNLRYLEINYCNKINNGISKYLNMLGKLSTLKIKCYYIDSGKFEHFNNISNLEIIYE